MQNRATISNLNFHLIFVNRQRDARIKVIIQIKNIKSNNNNNNKYKNHNNNNLYNNTEIALSSQ